MRAARLQGIVAAALSWQLLMLMRLHRRTVEVERLWPVVSEFAGQRKKHCRSLAEVAVLSRLLPAARAHACVDFTCKLRLLLPVALAALQLGPQRSRNMVIVSLSQQQRKARSDRFSLRVAVSWKLLLEMKVSPSPRCLRLVPREVAASRASMLVELVPRTPLAAVLR